MKLELPERAAQCAKRGCLIRFTHRHHTGCDKLWIRHFKHKRRTQKYKAFVARYFEFRSEDTVELCKDHHQEIHSIYFPIIGSKARAKGRLRHWSWKEADELMAELRGVCLAWLRKP